MKRTAVVAGKFYEGESNALAAEVERLSTSYRPELHGLPDRPGLPAQPAPIIERVIGAVCPHAGFIYSGKTAGAVYSQMTAADTFVILGPNHTGLGFEFSIMDEGVWEVPTGAFDIDAPLAGAIMKDCPLFTSDATAHRFEHSIEVQLPFIARFSPHSRIVPVAVMDASLEDCRRAGLAVAHAVLSAGKTVTIIASSDMSHYVSDEVARKKDTLANEKILALDPEGLYNVVKQERISMCGVLPTTVMLFAAIQLGARSARLVNYTTSAQTSGDYDRVVGYSGIVVT